MRFVKINNAIINLDHVVMITKQSDGRVLYRLIDSYRDLFFIGTEAEQFWDLCERASIVRLEVEDE